MYYDRAEGGESNCRGSRICTMTELRGESNCRGSRICTMTELRGESNYNCRGARISNRADLSSAANNDGHDREKKIFFIIIIVTTKLSKNECYSLAGCNIWEKLIKKRCNLQGKTIIYALMVPYLAMLTQPVIHIYMQYIIINDQIPIYLATND